MRDFSNLIFGKEPVDGYPVVKRLSSWDRALNAGIRRIPTSVKIVVPVLVVLLPLVLLLRYELGTSHLQSHWLSSYTADLTYQTEAGPSASIRFPTRGPFNERLGYVAAPVAIDSLTQPGRFAISAQARVSERFARHMDRGFSPPYVPKQQAGLEVLDRHGSPLSSVRYPRHVYAAADSIPLLVRETLLFIENRSLLDRDHPLQNPAIEWWRFTEASLQQATAAFGWTDGGHGGSTLATQLDKMRNSPGGRTTGPVEKLRQMASASVNAYLDGPSTLDARSRLVPEYLNMLPLSAIAGHGEVNGLGDGLWAWYHADLDSVTAQLRDPTVFTHPTQAQALAYRQVLQLVLSTRRPSYFLGSEAGHEALISLTDGYVPVLAEAGIISDALREAVLQVKPERRTRAEERPTESFIARKAANATRFQLLRLLDMSSLSALDGRDATVHTHYDAEAQRAVAALFEQIKDPAFVRQAGLFGRHMLDRGDPAQVEYAVVLYERTDHANVIRLQADTFEGPFDINGGSMLELGSTAKLRALITYLELVDEVYTQYAGAPADELRTAPAADSDPISRWVLQALQRTPDLSRRDLLDRAMARRYSANPHEEFFTGGGQHTFRNFRTSSDTLVPTVAHAFRHSINLPFIRMMRDIVNYHIARLPGQPGAMVADPSDERRSDYLAKFANQEGREFLNRFFEAYPATPDRRVLMVLGERNQHLSARRMAWVYRSVVPDAEPEEFVAFLRKYASGGGALPEEQLLRYKRMTSDADFTWQDLGYLASVHPLELWLAHYLRHNPEATRAEMLEASAEVRQEVYQWLFRRRAQAQNPRIRTILEQEAFVAIHKRWARLGYPFERLVPSYATAIGSSADRPSALTDLVGILIRDGVRYPTERIERLHLAEGTPFETLLTASPTTPEPVLGAEIAAVVRQAMVDVVERGSAIRARGAIPAADGSPLVIGAKTGTGDNRIRNLLADGTRTNIPMNRTSTLVFFAGDRFYGTITAYAPGPVANTYRFTSSLPSQILSLMGSSLTPLTVSPVEEIEEVEEMILPETPPYLQPARWPYTHHSVGPRNAAQMIMTGTPQTVGPPR